MKLRLTLLTVAALGGLAFGDTNKTSLVGKQAAAPVLRTFGGDYQFMGKLYYEGPATPRAPKCVVVLDFMSLECEPCRKELPAFLDVVRNSGGTNGIPMKYFLVSLDPLSKADELKAFLTANGVNPATEVLLDPYHKASDLFGVTAIPRTLVISPSGRIVSDIAGVQEQFRSLLTAGIKTAQTP